MNYSHKKSVIIALALLISLIPTGCSYIFPVEEAPLKPPLVEPTVVDYATTTVKKGLLESKYTGSCNVISKTTVNVKFMHSGGELSYLNNQMGQLVKKGDIIAQTTTENAKYDLDIANIDLKRLMQRQTTLLENVDQSLKYETLIAQIALEEARIDYNELNRTLSKVDDKDVAALATSRLYLEKAETQYNLLLSKAAAESPDLLQVKSEIEKQVMLVDKLKMAFENSTLRSPVTGVIVESSQYKIGDSISGGSSVATIADSSNLLVVTSDTSPKLKDNLKATIDVHNEKYDATMKTNTPKTQKLESSLTTYTYLFYFDKPASKLQYGDSYPFVTVLEKKDNVLIIPINCVQQLETNSAFVSVLDGKAKHDVPIHVGLRNETSIEVVDGLKEGDTIIYVK